MRISHFALTGLAIAAMSATAFAQSSMMSSHAMMGKPVTVTIGALNGSGETGTAWLTQSGPNVIVKIALKGTPTGVPQPAHIHDGTCAKLNPAPKYPLNSVVNGMSTSTVKGVTIAELTKEPYAINVHKSAKDIPTYVACGDIK